MGRVSKLPTVAHLLMPVLWLEWSESKVHVQPSCLATFCLSILTHQASASLFILGKHLKGCALCALMALEPELGPHPSLTLSNCQKLD